MAKISKNAKKLLALTLAGVMTVGTAVPASAAAEAPEAAVSLLSVGYNDLNDEQKAEVDTILAQINSVNFTTYYNQNAVKKNGLNIVANDWNSAVSAQAGLTDPQAATVTFSGSLTSGKKNTLDGKVDLTLSDGTKTSANIEFNVYVWGASSAAQTLATAINQAAKDVTVEASSDTDADIYAAAEAKANELMEDSLDAMANQDQAYMIRNYMDVSFGNTILDKAQKKWFADLIVTDKTNGETNSSSRVSLTYKIAESTEANEVLENLQPEAVSVTTETGDIPVGTVTDFKKYFGAEHNATNAITRSIEKADSRIRTAALQDKGKISGSTGEKVWIGTVTIELENGEEATGTVTVPLNIQKGAETYKDITITDNRTSTKVELGKDYELDGITVTLEKNDGSKETIVGQNIKNHPEKIVVDEGSYDNSILGTTNIAIRLVSDNSKFVTFPVQVYDTDTISNLEVNLSGNIKSVKSDDETILKGIGGGDVEVYKAGTTTATVTDDAGNSMVVKCVVSADGTVKYTTDFESYQVDKTIGTGFAELAKGQDVVVSVKDSEIASASYSVDSVGNGHVKITPTAVGSTTLTVSFGTNHKISYSYTITVSKTGAVKVEEKSKPTIQSISLPTATKTALQDAEYYGTANSGKELVSDTEAGKKASKKVIDSAVDADSLYVTVKTGSATDTVLLSTTDYGFSTAEYNEEASTIKVGFGGKDVSVEDITVRQKWECDNGYLKINAVDYSYVKGSDKYVTVSQEQNEDGNTIFVIKPAKRLNNNKWSVIFTDKNGAKTTVSGTGLNYRLGEKTTAVDAPEINSADFTAPSKMTYTIGESFDVTGASFSYELAAVGGTYTVEVTPDMFTLVSGEALDLSKIGEYKVVFNYGTYEKKDLVVTVKGAEKKFSAEELGVPAGDKISSVTVKSSDGKIKCGNYAESFAYFTADKTNTSAAVTISTAKGNTINVLVKVDEKGNITAEGEVQFKGQQAAVTAAELNLTPKKAVSSDTTVASAEVQGGKVIIKSLSAGSTVVTVTDKDGNTATINVSVAADGSITKTVHAYNADGWVNLGNGDWGYILNGERVVSDWAYVIEADPYNNNEVGKVWYHFDSDGKMQRGWIADETGWKIYLLDSNGRMAHSQWVNAPAQESLNRPAGIYHLNDDGSVQMNGWALAKDSDSVYWLCNAGNGLFEKDNPASWSNSKLW